MITSTYEFEKIIASITKLAYYSFDCIEFLKIFPSRMINFPLFLHNGNPAHVRHCYVTQLHVQFDIRVC